MEELFEQWADSVPIDNAIPLLKKAIRKRTRQGYSMDEILNDIELSCDGELVDWLDELWEDDCYNPGSRIVIRM